MKSQRTDPELRAKYRNEDRHSEHVTRLARGLFLQTHAALRIPVADWRLLETACRLHDVGFLLFPHAHAARSARIVLEEGLAGFTADERAVVAATILLHGRAWRTAQRTRVFARIKERHRTRALTLGAYLRVADALDHSHVQNASLHAVQVADGAVCVRVKSPGYDGNVACARQKADLWNAVLPLRIEFEAVPSSAGDGLFVGLLDAKAPVGEAARRILQFQYRLARDAEASVRSGENPEAVHDLRVALNRIRAALKFFLPVLPATTAEALRRELSEFRSRLGDARDAQVWMNFLESRAAARVFPDPGACLRFQRRPRQECRRRLAAVRTLIDSPAYAASMAEASRLVRGDWVQAARPLPSDDFAAFAVARLDRVLGRLLSLDPKGMNPGELHALRKAGKKARYGAEFSTRVLGTPVVRLADLLKGVTSALGDVHDMDVHLARSLHGVGRTPELDALMRRKRARALHRFQTAWKRLHKWRRSAGLRKILGKTARENRS